MPPQLIIFYLSITYYIITYSNSKLSPQTQPTVNPENPFPSDLS